MNSTYRNWAILAMMVLSAMLAVALRPTTSFAESRPALNLKSMVPNSLGDWRELVSSYNEVVDPARQQLVTKLYNDTLSRTYVDSNGYQIMLSIAYGKSQRDGMEMHKPDVCYPAQGFEIKQKEAKSISIENLADEYRVTKIVAENGARKEPLLYWTLVGTKPFQTRLVKKYHEFHYSLENYIPDGMLVRVSSIDNDEERAIKMQKRFINALYNNIDVEPRKRLFGHV